MMSAKAGNILIAAALFIVLLFSSTLIGETGGEEGSAAVEFAFINLSKVLSAHKGLLNVEEEVKGWVAESEKELARDQEAIDNLKNEIEMYSKSSEEYQKRGNEIEKMDLALTQKRRSFIMTRDDKLSRALKEAYQDIERAVRDYAPAKGIKAVLPRGGDIAAIKTNRPDDVLKWISLVEVVWSDDHLDISDAIITIVNGS